MLRDNDSELMRYIAALEEDNKALTKKAGQTRLAAFATLLLAISLFSLMGAEQKAPTSEKLDKVTASAFELVDENGKTRGAFQIAEGGNPLLELKNPDGKMQAQLAVGDDNVVFLTLLDRHENARVSLVVGPDGSPHLQMMNQAGTIRSNLALARDGTPALKMYAEGQKGYSILNAAGLGFIDERDKMRIGLALDPKGTPRIAASDKNGVPRISLFVLPDSGGAHVEMADKVGKPRLCMDFDDDTGPSIYLKDRNKKTRALFHVDGKDEPHLYLMDNNEKPLWKAP